MAEPVLPAVLAIDGGNSKTDLALVAADGTLLASLRGPGASHEEFGMPGAMRLLDGMVRQLAASAGLLSEGPVARHTSACLAGADLPEEEAQLTDAVRRQGWSLTSSVVNDTFAVLRAGLPAGRSWGVGVTCGAGINCVGVAPDGRTTRYLAFGALSGDWGGGGGLGRAVMWHAIRAEDGRGRSTALRAAVAAFFGMDSVYDVAVALHLRELSEDDLLGLPAVLLEAARAGDPIAVRLVERQAEEVCVMAVTAMRRLGLDNVPGTAVVLGGGVLEARDPLLTAAIERRFGSAVPEAVPHVVDASPVIGAAQLGLDHLGAEPDAHRRLRATRLSVPSRHRAIAPCGPSAAISEISEIFESWHSQTIVTGVTPVAMYVRRPLSRSACPALGMLTFRTLQAKHWGACVASVTSVRGPQDAADDLREGWGPQPPI